MTVGLVLQRELADSTPGVRCHGATVACTDARVPMRPSFESVDPAEGIGNVAATQDALGLAKREEAGQTKHVLARQRRGNGGAQRLKAHRAFAMGRNGVHARTR